MEQKVILNLSSLSCSIFWDTTPCSPLKINRSFKGKYRLPFQDPRISQAKDQHEAGSNCFIPVYNMLFHVGVLLGLFFEA
jgi:hypothetical protein